MRHTATTYIINCYGVFFAERHSYFHKDTHFQYPPPSPPQKIFPSKVLVCRSANPCYIDQTPSEQKCGGKLDQPSSTQVAQPWLRGWTSSRVNRSLSESGILHGPAIGVCLAPNILQHKSYIVHRIHWKIHFGEEKCGTTRTNLYKETSTTE